MKPDAADGARLVDVIAQVQGSRVLRTDNSGVLVVMPTLNEAGTIARVRDELDPDLPFGADVGFGVCGGGSTDGTQQAVADLTQEYQRR